jgi:hypothetical protein
MEVICRFCQAFTGRLAAILRIGAEEPEAPVTATGLTFRRCLRLCLPALIVGAVLRISLLAAIPGAYYGKDSNSYFTTANKLWNHGEFELPAKRRYLYPLVLSGAAVLPGPATVSVAILQHGVGLAMLVGLGWIVGHLVKRPGVWVPPFTLMMAIYPRMLWYEHEMIAEVFVLGALVLTVALALPLSRLRTSRGLLWFLLAAALIIAFKPHGRPLWLALVGLGAVLSWGVWNWKHGLALAGSLIILVTGGSDSQGSWLLLSSSLPLVKLEGETYRQYRDLVRPFVEESRKDFANYATRQRLFKKDLNTRDDTDPLGPEWAKLCKDRKRYGKVARALALEGIMAQPFTYAGMVARKTILAMADNHTGEMMRPQHFWAEQIAANNGRWVERRLPEMRLVFGTDEAGFQRMAEEGSKRSLWIASWTGPLDRSLQWAFYHPGTKQDEPPRYGLRWPGVLAVGGLLTCFWPSRFRRYLILWFPSLFYLGLVYSVGDSVARYLHPVDWALLALIPVGGDALLDWMHAGWQRWKAREGTVA